MQEPRKYLSQLGLSDSEITVYLAMTSGAQTARDLLKATRLKRPTVYYALGCLEKRGLISKTGLEGDKKFTIESSKRLIMLAEEKALEANKLRDRIISIIPSLETKILPEQKPSVAFFEGVEAVKNVVMDMLYCKNKQIYSVVPKANFFWQVGKDFVETFVEERVRRNIKTKNLWEEPINQELIKQYYTELSQIKILPAAMQGKFETTVFLYDNKTLYVSSIKNSYAVIITSKEHHQTMQAWFDGLWGASKSH